MKILDLLASIAKLIRYNSCYKCTEKLRRKRPRHQNLGILSLQQKLCNPMLGAMAKEVTVVNLSSFRTSISEAELDEFYNEINDLVPKLWFFKNYYQAYTNNLNRLRPEAINGNLDLSVLHSILDDKDHPTKFLPVFLYHVKSKFKFTTAVYEWYRVKYRPY
jgi:hypothetical protein